MEITFSQDDLSKVAKQLLESVPGKLLAFYGSMGAGKTTLIKALLKELGASDHGSSPTFGIVNEYHGPKNKLLAFHFDFYRLEDEIEALDLGLEDYLSQDAWIFMEWPEKIEGLLPENTTRIRLKVRGKQNRVLTF